MPVSTRRELSTELESKHGSEDCNRTVPLETPAASAELSPPTKSINDMDHYELSAFLETQGFGSEIISLVVHQTLDGATLAMYVAVPQYLEIAQSELQLASILEAVKLKKIVHQHSAVKPPAASTTGPDQSQFREDSSRIDMKLVPKLPDTSGRSSFDPTRWRAYGISVVGFVHLSDPELAKYYKQAFNGVLARTADGHVDVVLTSSQQRLDVYVANSMLHDPPRIIRDLLVSAPKYTLNGVQSGLIITASVTAIVYKHSDAMQDSIYDRCVSTKAVTDPYDLKPALQTLRENFDQLGRQGMPPDDQLQLVLLRRLISELIKLPHLVDVLTIPYNLLKKEHPDDPAELLDFIDSKGDEFKQTMSKSQTASRPAPSDSGGVTTKPSLTRGGICIPDRERNACPDRASCKGKHVHTGILCTNKWMGKVGLCSNWENCHNMHPYDESKWKISRWDAVAKYKDAMKADP